MKLGIIIYSKDPEVVWNAFRLANLSLKNEDKVKVFLLAGGVEYESLDSEQFDIVGQAKSFSENKGIIYACGTCIKSRGSEGSNMCPISTMQDLYDVISESDKVLTF
jgi:uncharacterized protein involved in oxidation of intracellular sulfur